MQNPFPTSPLRKGEVRRGFVLVFLPALRSKDASAAGV